VVRGPTDLSGWQGIARTRFRAVRPPLRRPLEIVSLDAGPLDVSFVSTAPVAMDEAMPAPVLPMMRFSRWRRT
jgi:hypothetical protein